MTASARAGASPLASAFKDVFVLLPRVLERAWIPVAFVHLARALTREYFTYTATLIQARGREELALLASAIALQFLIEMAWSAAWAFIVIDAVRRATGSTAPSARELLVRLNRLLIEGVRAIAAILYRVPWLLVPGLVEFVRLMFVPHVVLLDQDYEAGRVDALERSRELTRGRWTMLIFSAALLLALDTSIERFAQGSTEVWAWENPWGFGFTLIFTFFTNLMYEVFLVALFLKLSMMRALRKDDAN
ncbi:MAG: hypothetical protein V4760_14420 [Bdellovibrionota bacterium]